MLCSFSTSNSLVFAFLQFACVCMFVCVLCIEQLQAFQKCVDTRTCAPHFWFCSVTINFRILRIHTDMCRADFCMSRWCWWWYCCGDAGAGCAGLCVGADGCAGVVVVLALLVPVLLVVLLLLAMVLVVVLVVRAAGGGAGPGAGAGGSVGAGWCWWGWWWLCWQDEFRYLVRTSFAYLVRTQT